MASREKQVNVSIKNPLYLRISHLLYQFEFYNSSSELWIIQKNNSKKSDPGLNNFQIFKEIQKTGHMIVKIVTPNKKQHHTLTNCVFAYVAVK